MFMNTIFLFGDIIGCNVHGILDHRFSNSIGIISSTAGVLPQMPRYLISDAHEWINDEWISTVEKAY